MSYEVKASEIFRKELKRLSKKYRSLVDDVEKVVNELAEDPFVGVELGKSCYKIRIAITSKGKGKSGGGRLITFVRVVKKQVILLTIYDKSDFETISDSDLNTLLKNIELE